MSQKRNTLIKKILLTFVLVTAIMFSSNDCFSQDNFLSTSLGRQLINAGLSFITNPGDFLFDLHHDAMDYTPLPDNKFLGIHTNLLLLANPGLVNSVSGKLAFGEGKLFPQIGVFGGVWKTLALDILLTDDSVTADLSGWSAGFFIAKRVDPKTRLFTHISYSRIGLNVTLAEKLELVPGVIEFQSLSAGAFDTYIFTGIEHTTGFYEDKKIIAQTGYGVRSNKIVAKILLHTGIMEMGLTIYPEGLLVVHPVLNMQFRF